MAAKVNKVNPLELALSGTAEDLEPASDSCPPPPTRQGHEFRRAHTSRPADLLHWCKASNGLWCICSNHSHSSFTHVPPKRLNNILYESPKFLQIHTHPQKSRREPNPSESQEVLQSLGRWVLTPTVHLQVHAAICMPTGKVHMLVSGFSDLSLPLTFSNLPSSSKHSGGTEVVLPSPIVLISVT